MPLARSAGSVIFAALALSLAACGSSSHPPRADIVGGPGVDSGIVHASCAPFPAGDGVDHGAPSTSYPAPHAPFPTLIDPLGNPVLSAPRVVLVFYPSYPYAAQIETFAKTIGAQSYWSDAVGEYGVGPLGWVATKELTGQTAPPTIDGAAVETLVHDALVAGTFGPPDASTIYTVVFPETTTITETGPFGTAKSCSAFGGYHDDVEVTVGGETTNVPYAVLPTCAAFGDLVGLDAVTGAMSHEWAEASTDPYPTTNGGGDASYQGVDDDHFAWELLGGAENGDLCALRREAFFKPDGFDFMVQTAWSNRAASAGGDPCAPKRPGVYFQAVPVLPDSVVVDVGGSGFGTRTLGVNVPTGGSATLEVDLFSDADTGGPWSVEAHDLFSFVGAGAPTLSFAWDRGCGTNGEKLHLTITVTGVSPFGKAHPFVIESTLGEQVEIWPAFAVTK